jgi:GT2 family glycosyltransferase
MSLSQTNVIAVVVTYNRQALLLQCLAALSRQTRAPDLILIVDNASTDGCREALSSEGWLKRENVKLLTLIENIGGAGGFATALQNVLDRNESAWVWLMDDDAVPRPDALEILLTAAGGDYGNLYGSLAVAGEECAWGLRLIDRNRELIVRAEDMPPLARVAHLPFLGFLVHTDLVHEIGLPDATLFISVDDVEYCMRARKHGANVICVSQSRIEHPRAAVYFFSVLGFKPLTCQRLLPWRRYYEVRNNILFVRKHQGLGRVFFMLRYQSLRLLASLCCEPRKFAQLWAYLTGMIDGILGIKGKRHVFWRISE